MAQAHLGLHLILWCLLPKGSHREEHKAENVWKTHSPQTLILYILLRVQRKAVESRPWGPWRKKPRGYTLSSFCSSPAGNWWSLDSPNESFAETLLPEAEFSYILKGLGRAMQNTARISVQKKGGTCKRKCFCGGSLICNQETRTWKNLNNNSKINSLVRSLNLENGVPTAWFMACGCWSTNCQKRHSTFVEFSSWKRLAIPFSTLNTWKVVFSRRPDKLKK